MTPEELKVAAEKALNEKLNVQVIFASGYIVVGTVKKMMPTVPTDPKIGFGFTIDEYGKSSYGIHFIESVKIKEFNLSDQHFPDPLEANLKWRQNQK